MPQDAHLAAVAQSFATAFETSWNAQDGSAYGDAYWPDAELVDPTGQVWDGREAIAAMHVALWNGPARGTRVSAKVRRTRPLAESLAVVDLEIDVRGFDPPPPGALLTADGAARARLKHVVERRGDNWKIVASQNTFVAKGAGPE